MNIKRWMSGLLGFPLIAALLIFGNKYVVDFACTIFALIALNEYFNCFKGKANPVVEVGYLSAISIMFLHLIDISILIMFIPIILLILFLKVILTDMKATINDIAITLLGIIYVVGSIVFIPLINGLENGKILIWYIIISAWVTDTFAYIIGKNFGRHKFTTISPNKTLEGSIAGIIGSTIVAIIYTIIINNCYNLDISYVYIIIVSIILSIVGQIGDLSASSIKRYNEKKDFGNLIPGHGGIIDRMDSIMFIAPFVYLFLVLMKSII